VKIVVLDGRTLAPEREAWSGLGRFGDLVYHDVSMPDEVAARAAGATILVTNKTPLGQDLLDSLPELRFITVLATGFDCVDIVAARRRGIPVSNVPVYGTDTVAQYVFALLLEMCHHVALHAEAVKAGQWSRQPDFSLRKTRLRELVGKTMGIVGFGRIGRRTGELARAFGMNVLACGHRGTTAVADSAAVSCQLDELFARSDVISLHCPLTPETVGLVNRERLALVKPDALLINTARGGLIVEEDLAEALNAGKLAGAAVDVVSTEPIRPDNPLRSAKNCLVTPHIAWATDEARGRLMETTVANVAAFLAGKPINVVN
jgi:glycerate dehydrogenase